jgi:hypothetical protein
MFMILGLKGEYEYEQNGYLISRTSLEMLMGGFGISGKVSLFSLLFSLPLLTSNFDNERRTVHGGFMERMFPRRVKKGTQAPYGSFSFLFYSGRGREKRKTRS